MCVCVMSTVGDVCSWWRGVLLTFLVSSGLTLAVRTRHTAPSTSLSHRAFYTFCDSIRIKYELTRFRRLITN